jgi:hypothetical protein
MTRLIDADALKRELRKAFNCENATKYGNKDAKQQEQSDSTIMLYEVADIIEDTIDNAPTVPLPDFKDGYKQAVLDGKTNYSRPKGEWEPIVDENGAPYWEENYEPMFLCTHCKCKSYKKPFCPHCGADMRGGTDNGTN